MDIDIKTHRERNRLLRESLLVKVLLLDGSMGVMLQRMNLGESGTRGRRFLTHSRPLASNLDILCLSRPEKVAEVHAAYLQAGADIIETNTFNANVLSQKKYATDNLVEEINLAGARIARREADRFTSADPSRPRFVAGSMGPTSLSASLPVDVENPEKRAVDFQTLEIAYYQQAYSLICGGVDFLLIETSYDSLNAKAAASGARRAMQELGCDVPLVFSMTVSDASGRILSGHTPEAYLTSIAHFKPLAVGFNCSTGTGDLTEPIRRLAKKSQFATVFYPNAGHPDQLGNYGLTPDEFVEMMRPLLENSDLNIVGGCCGTTPEHISALRKFIDGAQFSPHISRGKDAHWLAGFDAFDDDRGFINVGERCNVAGSRKFLRMIQNNDMEGALAIARQQVEAGAMVLDINMDDAMLDSEQEMRRFIRILGSDPLTASVPWMIDSSDFNVIKTALQEIGGKAIVNSISLRDGEEEFKRQASLINSYGAAVVVMLFDEIGQATTFERKIEIAARAYKILTEECGYDARDIIFDPNILTIATGMSEHDAYAADYIKAVEWISKNLPGTKTSGGVSNLSFSFRGNDYVRQAMHAVFLYHAVSAGLSMAIVSPAAKLAYSDVPEELLNCISAAVLNTSPDASEQLVEIASHYNKKASEITPEIAVSSKEDMSADNRLKYSLRTGNPEMLEENLKESVMIHGNATAVVEGPLMSAMADVGELFGSGKMFLPQVVKSARIMRMAVDFLRPMFDSSASVSSSPKGRFLMATVRGDVHDIGKNIAGAVLQCNGYDVVDLGVQVEASDIVKAAEKYNPDFIGLSGLISPSLEEMVTTVTSLRAAGISVPVFIGGAATSELHTALKVAPAYEPGIVLRVADASQNPVMASRLAANDTSLLENIIAHRRKVVAAYQSRQRESEESECMLPDVDWSKEKIIKPSFVGDLRIDDIPVAEVLPFINYTYFYKCWGVSPESREVVDLKREADALLNEMISKGARMKALLRICRAYSDGDSIRLEDGVCFDTPRQKARAGRRVCLSLSDFVAPKQFEDHIGCFMVTIGDEIRNMFAEFRTTSTASDDLLLQSVCDRLAEATSEWLHLQVRRKYWGYEEDGEIDFSAIRRGKYMGIRPAIGYPSLPDQQQMHRLASLLHPELIGVKVTVNGALQPSSTVAGLYLVSPRACYFTVE